MFQTLSKRLLMIGGALLIALSSIEGNAWQQETPKDPPTPAAQNSPATAQTQPQTPETSPENEAAQLPPTNDPKEIVRRSVEIDRKTLERARSYTCTQREVLKHLDKHGDVKSTEIKTYDVSFYYGEEYSRLAAQRKGTEERR
jgi:glucose/arabinose dehydrogenase